MNALPMLNPANVLQSDFSIKLTQTLLHFLWQAAAIGLVILALNHFLRNATSRLRYGVNFAALLLMLLCLPVTFAVVSPPARPALAKNEHGGESKRRDAGRRDIRTRRSTDDIGIDRDPIHASPVASSPAKTEPKSEPAASPAARSSTEPRGGTNAARVASTSPLVLVAPWAVSLYLLGVAAMLLRVAVALRGGQKLRRQSSPIHDAALLETVKQQARELGLKAIPAIAWCARVSVPIVVGILRPMVLLPATLATGLSPRQLQAILMHELAHIRRYDLLVNLLQRLAESLLFFHPAVWYVSRRLSDERENCCDDLVLETGCERIAYADAMVRMAEVAVAGGHPRTLGALAATGEKPSQFKRRVLRVLGVEHHSRLRLNRSALLLLALVPLALLFAPMLLPESAETRTTAAPQAARPPVVARKPNPPKEPAKKYPVVRVVDPNIKLCWINVGVLDGAKVKTTYRVYGKAGKGKKPGAPKGTIEISRILGPHLAECRIVSEDLKNPIAKGDELRPVPAKKKGDGKGNDDEKRSSKSKSGNEEKTADTHYYFPITVTGRATDRKGKPVVGAKIYLASRRAEWKRLAETTTDKDGRYVFEEIELPIKRATTNRGGDVGGFEVFGQAKGYGLAWRPEKWLFPKKNPWKGHKFDDDHDLPKVFTPKDKIVLDLKFPPSVKLGGRIVDDAGKPVVGAELAIRDCDPVPKGGYKSERELRTFHMTHSLELERAIDRAGGDQDSKNRRQWEVRVHRSAAELPDEDLHSGEGLPAPLDFTATQTGAKKYKGGRPLYTDGMRVTFVRPREVPVRVLYGDTGKPAADVYVSGGHPEQGYSKGVSDANGRLTLRLPPGEGKMQAIPYTEMPYLAVEGLPSRVDAKDNKPVTVRNPPASVVEVTVIDADSGKELSGVDLWRGTTRPGVGGRARVSKRLHHFRSFERIKRGFRFHINRPRTNAKGKLRALFKPGTHRIGVGLEAFPKGYRPVEKDGVDIECKAGKTTRLTFRMRRVTDAKK